MQILGTLSVVYEEIENVNNNKVDTIKKTLASLFFYRNTFIYQFIACFRTIIIIYLRNWQFKLSKKEVFFAQ